MWIAQRKDRFSFQASERTRLVLRLGESCFGACESQLLVDAPSAHPAAHSRARSARSARAGRSRMNADRHNDETVCTEHTDRMTQVLSFWADASLAKELDAEAAIAGVPRSDLLNQAVREFLYRLR
jgi:hypothetical protein